MTLFPAHQEKYFLLIIIAAGRSRSLFSADQDAGKGPQLFMNKQAEADLANSQENIGNLETDNAVEHVKVESSEESLLGRDEDKNTNNIQQQPGNYTVKADDESVSSKMESLKQEVKSDIVVENTDGKDSEKDAQGSEEVSSLKEENSASQSNKPRLDDL